MLKNIRYILQKDYYFYLLLLVILAVLFPFLVNGQASTTITSNVTTGSSTRVLGWVAKNNPGTFVIDHPLDPENKLLFHSFVESPDVKNIYDGIVTLNKNGEGEVLLPNYFETLNKDYRYLVTPIGRSEPGLFLKREIKNNRFVIAGGAPGTRVSWQVTGIRQDPLVLANPVIVEVEKGPDALVNKGEYLFDGYEDK